MPNVIMLLTTQPAGLFAARLRSHSLKPNKRARTHKLSTIDHASTLLYARLTTPPTIVVLVCRAAYYYRLIVAWHRLGHVPAVRPAHAPGPCDLCHC